MADDSQVTIGRAELESMIRRAVQEGSRSSSPALSHSEIEALVRETVASTVDEICLKLGVDYREPLVLQRNLQTLDAWVKTMDSVKKRTLASSLGLLLLGLAGVLVLGLRAWIGRGP